MKLALFIISFVICLSQYGQNTWTQKADYPHYVAGAVAFNIGSKGYVGTGQIRSFWEYNPVMNKWTGITNYPGTPMHAVAFSINDKGYVGTGISGPGNTFHDVIWQYDPSNDTWTKKANLAGVKRSEAIAFAMNGRGYIGTGWNDSNGFLRDFWQYNPLTDKWAQKADFPGGFRVGAAGFSVNGKGYIGLGYDSLRAKNDLWEYNPTNDSWTQKASFPGTPRSRIGTFVIGNACYLGTGVSDIGYTNDFWKYDTDKDTWTMVASIGSLKRQASVAFAINCKGYLGTGADISTPYNDFWEYDPVYSDPLPPNSITPPTNLIVCYGMVTTLSTTGIGTLGWYSDSIGGKYLGSGHIFKTRPLNANTNFFVQDSTCTPSALRLQIKVIVKAMIVTVVTLTGATLKARQQGASYEWMDCTTGTIIQGENNQTYNPKKNGQYKVIISQGLCSDTSECYKISTNSLIDQMDYERMFSVYPNPSEGRVYISASEDFNLKITDFAGRVIEDRENMSEISLPKGIYIFRFKVQGTNIFKKVLIL